MEHYLRTVANRLLPILALEYGVFRVDVSVIEADTIYQVNIYIVPTAKLSQEDQIQRLFHRFIPRDSKITYVFPKVREIPL